MFGHNPMSNWGNNKLSILNRNNFEYLNSILHFIIKSYEINILDDLSVVFSNYKMQAIS